MFVLPSLFEPFGMTALEALACRTPVVASRLGGIRTVITSEKNGLLVDPSDPHEFAGAMIRLLGDRPLAERLGQAGHDTIRTQFSWEQIGARALSYQLR
jgi:glycosyltransferase involved in cell wall biosynthesis